MTNRAGTAGTVQAFRFGGVPIRLHFSFVLFLLFLAVTGIGEGSGGGSVVFLAGVFASVLLHEFAHAIVASRMGVRTEEIVILPIGGVSRLERRLLPLEEISVAGIGPLVNLIIAVVLFSYIASTGQPVALDVDSVLALSGGMVVQKLAFANLLLMGFNLIPAFPMDGGRIARAILSLIRPEDEATRTMAWIGRMIAISMAFYGFFYSETLVLFLAFFIWASAAQENVAAVGRTLTYDTPVRAAMITEFRVLDHSTTMRDAAQLLVSTTQQDFAVLHNDQVVGVVDRKRILHGLASEGPDAYIAGVMDRDVVVIEGSDELTDHLPTMARPGRCAMVVEQGELTGMLTSGNLAEFLKLRRAGLDT